MKKHAENIVLPGYETTAAVMAYAFVLVFSLLWIISIFAGAYMMRQGHLERVWAGLIRYFFAPACHQISSRSFICFGYPLAVCARCTGLYAGFIAGVVMFPFLKAIGSEKTPRPWVLGAGILPMIVEWTWSHAAGSASTNALRAVSGGVAGAAVAFWVLPAVFQLVHSRGRR
jgi:uncharacterized membrane protein